MTSKYTLRSQKLIIIFLSWFYVGKAPKAPGTFGSLATFPLILLLHYLHFNLYTIIAIIISLYLIAVYFTQKIQQELHLHDPQWIVVDEVIGMLITWSFVRRVDLVALTTVFIFFRFFDIIKIWPASYFDKIKHGHGTITDDVVSGLYAGIFTYFALHFF